jgi:hypothetical protein
MHYRNKSLALVDSYIFLCILYCWLNEESKININMDFIKCKSIFLSMHSVQSKFEIATAVLVNFPIAYS